MKNGVNQTEVTEQTNNDEQKQTTRDPLRELPPKSPSNRRLMPNIPTKAKRGEVRRNKLFFNTCVK